MSENNSACNLSVESPSFRGGKAGRSLGVLGGQPGLAKKKNYGKLNKRDHSFDDSSNSDMSDQESNQVKFLKPNACRPRLGTDGATVQWFNQVNNEMANSKILNSPPVKL